MPSTKSYLEFVLEQLSQLDDISYRYMMGEYIIYYKDKVVGGVYDDRFLLKATPSIKEILKDVTFEEPYPNGSLMYLVDLEDRALLQEVIPLIYDDLKAKKTKRL